MCIVFVRFPFLPSARSLYSHYLIPANSLPHFKNSLSVCLGACLYCMSIWRRQLRYKAPRDALLTSLRWLLKKTFNMETTALPDWTRSTFIAPLVFLQKRSLHKWLKVIARNYRLGQYLHGLPLTIAAIRSPNDQCSYHKTRNSLLNCSHY